MAFQMYRTVSVKTVLIIYRIHRQQSQLSDALKQPLGGCCIGMVERLVGAINSRVYKNTRKKTVEKELRQLNLSWGQAAKQAQM